MKFVLMWLPIVAMLIGTFLGHIFEWSFISFFVGPLGIALGAYWIFSINHFGLQAIFAPFNRRQIKMLEEKGKDYSPTVKVGIVVPIFHEKPEILEKTIRSIVSQTRPHDRVICVLDGHDETLETVLSNILEVKPIRIDNLLIDYIRFPLRLLFHKFLDFLTFQGKRKFEKELCFSEERIQELLTENTHHLVFGSFFQEVANSGRYVIVSQPWGGKRSACLTGEVLLRLTGVDLIATTDSDTVFEPNALEKMIPLLADPQVGAVVGEVRILNRTQNLLTLLIAARYAAAFHLERSAQSVFGCVCCVSGPIGIYRAEALHKVIAQWANQTFWNRYCTYGEDRHRSELISRLGYKILFQPSAICWSETPEQLKGFLIQQLRWARSFTREYLTGAYSYHTRPWWLGFDLSFSMFFPFFLAYALLFQLVQSVRTNEYGYLILWIITIIVMAFPRVIYGLLAVGRKDFIWFPLYGFVYLLFLMPVKFLALISLHNTGWGTRGKKNWDSAGIIGMICLLFGGAIILGLLTRPIAVETTAVQAAVVISTTPIVNTSLVPTIEVKTNKPSYKPLHIKHEETITFTDVEVIAQQGLNVRLEPSLNGTKITAIPSGSRVKVRLDRIISNNGYQWVITQDGSWIALKDITNNWDYLVPITLLA